MANGTSEEEMRKRAYKRVKQKRDFLGHVLTYVLVNIFLVFVWWMGGANTSNMWFLWPLAGWGIFVVGDGIRTYGFPDTGARFEADVEAEMEKIRRTGGRP